MIDLKKKKGGAETGEHFAQSIFHFFRCYINMLKGAFYLVFKSNELVWHCKLDGNVEKAMKLSAFKVGVHPNLSEILRGLGKG